MALSEILAISLAVTAGCLQIMGYVFYIQKTLKEDVEPNAATWFMFAYGTLILGILEWDSDAKWPILILPTTCATLAAVVAIMCWHRGTLRWPENRGDQVAFVADVILTICYVGAWALTNADLITEEKREVSVLAFLVGSNLTTLTAFYPLLRGTQGNPLHESALPWKIWTSAYIVLGVATYFSAGPWTELMIYPVLNAILHGLVAWLSRSKRQVHYKIIVPY